MRQQPEARQAATDQGHASDPSILNSFNTRRALLLATSVLALGGCLADAPVSFADTALPANPLTAPVPKTVYGLSGLGPMTPGSPTEEPAGWNQISGPHSAYPTQWVRLVVHPAFLQESETQIESYIKYAENNLDYRPGKGHMAPVVVSLSTTNSDETAANGGVDRCDQDIPNSTVTNPKYNLKMCLAEDEKIMRQNVAILMRKYPVKNWTAQNEPEDGEQPTNTSEGGSRFAVKLWVMASKIAKAIHRHQVILGGEMWNYPSPYEERYNQELARAMKQYKLHLFGYADHPYRPINCADLTSQEELINNLIQNGEFDDPKKGGDVKEGEGIYHTEAAVALSMNFNCANDQDMANNIQQSTATITPEELSGMAQAQKNAAETEMHLNLADAGAQDHTAYYGSTPASPKCWSGGSWDSGLWAANGREAHYLYAKPDGTGIAGNSRVAFYVLTGQEQQIPSSLLNPTTLAQTQLDEKIDIPPVNWTPVSGKPAPDGQCHYATPLVHKVKHTAKHHVHYTQHRKHRIIH